MKSQHDLHSALILRAQTSLAGSTLPFDKLYIFPEADAALIPKIFRSALVFPVRKVLAQQIEAVAKAAVAFSNNHNHTFHRTRTEAETAVLGVGTAAAAQLRDAKALLAHPRLAVVPVLFTRYGSRRVSGSRFHKGRAVTNKTKADAIFPAYLSARPGNQTNMRLIKDVLTASSYFIWAHEVIRPVCLICPKHQDMLQGECSLGSVDCYRYATRATASDFYEGVKLYRQLVAAGAEPVVAAPTGA